MVGGTVVEDVARHWNTTGGACQEHRFWQCVCWEGVRSRAIAGGGAAGLRAAIPCGLARAGPLPTGA
eukprot:1345802-Lingulodinium_polyedra.AAC.1